MKKQFVAVIGIVALLVGLMGGYLLSPEVNLWMAEMEVGEVLVERALSGSSEVIEHLAGTGQWVHMLKDQRESCVVVENLLHDGKVFTAMATNPAYAVLSVETAYPFVRIIQVENHKDQIVDVWMHVDRAAIAALYPEDAEMRNQVLFDATAATIRVTHKAFPNVPYVYVYWASFPRKISSVSGVECVILGSDISIAGGEALFDWAENADADVDILIELVEAGEVGAMQYGYFVAPEYCTGSLLRLSDDPHPWEIEDE